MIKVELCSKRQSLCIDYEYHFEKSGKIAKFVFSNLIGFSTG